MTERNTLRGAPCWVHGFSWGVTGTFTALLVVLYLIYRDTDMWTIQSFKRHTAREPIRLCEQTNKDCLLNQFAYFKKAHKRDSDHQVWQGGIYPKLVQSDTMLTQKIAYIHENPVRRGWVDAPEHWRYSSGRNYFQDDQSVLEIDLLEPC